MVGIDGSDGSSRALDFAMARAQQSGERVVVAHVIEWSPYTFNTPQENDQRHQRREEELQQAEQSLIEPALERLKAAGIEASGRVRHGHAAKTLSQLAKAEGADMVVIGRRGVGSLQALLFGSVAGSLVQVASMPVTVVP